MGDGTGHTPWLEGALSGAWPLLLSLRVGWGLNLNPGLPTSSWETSGDFLILSLDFLFPKIGLPGWAALSLQPAHSEVSFKSALCGVSPGRFSIQPHPHWISLPLPGV